MASCFTSYFVSFFGEEDGGLWVLKLRRDGTVEWQRTYGGVGAESIQLTGDGGYIVAGGTGSFGAGGGKIHDVWVLKLKPDGSTHPSCGFVRDTRISEKDSGATVKTTSVSPIDSSANTQDSSSTIQVTDFPANIFCP